jgi:replicative DNA helicase
VRAEIGEVVGGLPSSVDAERTVLGGIIVQPGLIYEAAAELRPEHFYLETHQRVFRGMLDLFDAGISIEPIALGELLKKRRELDSVGGVTGIAYLEEGVPQRVSIAHYIAIIREKHNLRTLLFAANAVAGQIADGDDSSECAAALEDALVRVAIAGKSGRHISELMQDATKEIERLRTVKETTLGLTLDFEPLDSSTTGIRKDELWVIGARANVGKTPFAMQIALANARLGKQVDVYELEMSDAQTSNRFIVHYGAAHPWKLRDPRRMSEKEVLNTFEGAAEIAQLPLWVDDSGSLTIRELKSRILAGIRKRNTQLVIVDYIQLIKGEGKRYEVTSDAAAGLREIVRKTKVPIIALSQVNRNIKDPNKAPDLGDLRESGVIEQEANVVVIIHRPPIKDGDNEDALSLDGKFILAKVREGVRGPEAFTFNEKTLTFEPKYMKGIDHATKN